MKQIICMKWGSMYGPEYVNTLYRMIERHITPPFRLVCLTDDASGIIKEVDCFPCPEINIPAPYNLYPWRKITLWDKKVADLQGEVLFLDLDLVIVDNIDSFFDYGKGFHVIENWTQPGKGIGNTSVYRFTVGSHPELLTNLVQDFEGYHDKYRNSQTYISKSLPEIHFWPSFWCRSFKIDCVPSGIKRWFITPKIPNGAKIIAFPGDPNPPDAAIGRWPVNRWYKKLHKHIRPAKWVADCWR